MLTAGEHRRLVNLYRTTRLEYRDRDQWRPLHGSSEAVGIVSAWNPWGKLFSPDHNAKQDALLYKHLVSYRITPTRARGESRDLQWREDCWVYPYEKTITGILLQSYRQYAAFMLIGNQRWLVWWSGQTERIL